MDLIYGAYLLFSLLTIYTLDLRISIENLPVLGTPSISLTQPAELSNLVSY